MTATASGSATAAGSAGGIRRRLGSWPVVVIAVILLAWIGGRGHRGGEPLDPRSTEPLGTKALVVLLREEGASVRITSSALGPDTTSALLLRDQLSKTQRAGIRQWVRAGATLVVADPLSEFVPPLERTAASIFSDPNADTALRPRCSLALFDRVTRLDSPAAVPYRTPAGAIGCFPRGKGYVVVAAPVGRGTIISIGGAGPFINSKLASADNSVLAVSALGAREGARIAVLRPAAVGGGDKTLRQLISRRVKDAMWQLLIAFGLVVAWRARRLGRPVLEPQLVDVPGSELVVAVGNLLAQAQRRDQAAGMLRRHLRRTLGDRLGLPSDAPPEAIAAAVGGRTSVPPERVAAVLSNAPLASDADLVALARAVEHIRKEITHA